MKTLSIIIPTLNEAKHIQKTLNAVEDNALGIFENEIIIVDGGSSDRTKEIACQNNIRFLSIDAQGRGRAQGLNRGAQESQGQILLFLDADCHLPPAYDLSIQFALEEEKCVGGAFEFALEGDEFGLRVVEKINRFRYFLFRRYYGDQGLFVRREVFEKIGGYPDQGILEASEFCRSMHDHGKVKLINKPMLTSSRRFINGGIYKVLACDFRIWFYDFIGMDAQRFAGEYWQENANRT